MHISHIKISNILGIAELEFSAGAFNEISGPNGKGKTSILEAIKGALEGGHDATLLRRGAEQGEAVLVLDDGTEISKRVREDASVTEIRQGGKKLARPVEKIRALTDMISVNPVDFLLAPKKDRVRVLLESMPLAVDAEKLAQISGQEVPDYPGVHALHVIERVSKDVYDARTGVNRAVREKESTINQLRQAIPAEAAAIDGDENSLTEKLNEINAARDAEMTRITTKLEGIRSETQQKIDAIKAKAQEDIDALREQLATTERAAGRQRELSSQRFVDQMQPISDQLRSIRENRDLHARRAQTLDTINILQTELEELSEEAAAHTKALADIEQYKSELLSALPIPGLEVKDGEIYRDGVPLDRLNTASQVDIAVEIAKQRAGKLGVICVDRIEMLDSAAFEAFREKSMESGLQLFVSRVSDDEFAINTDE
ncbi:hypothetical protein [Paraburkholderia phenoliruptrix]|uniref:hypothetical protein n=1 Tax=Paraburkholderia phenoliruptrix TaxID=252970 RepID=UPI0034CDD238